MKAFLQKPFILLLILGIALALTVYKVKSKPPVAHEELSFPSKTVEVITLKKRAFRSRAVAYGYVEPAVLLKAKTEVNGKISYIHPSLKKGSSLAKGTVVLRIEPTTYEFSLDQSRAELASSESSLVQLQIEEESTRRSVEIARHNLEIGENELARLRAVWKKRLISRSAVDAEEQKVLQLRQQLEDLQGKLAGFSSRRSAIEAQISQSKTRLAQSEDTLGRTEIRLPFDARIGEVYVEKGEYTAVGKVLFEASGTQAVEINAQLPVQQFYPLIMGSELYGIDLHKPENLQFALLKMQLEASVRLVGNDADIAKWQGELLRISESIDPERDTIGIVVAVNNPYENVIPGKRPPLLKGMYAAVELSSRPRDMMVIPRKAIHQSRVYVANADDRLEIRAVNIIHKQGQLVLIDGGVEEGERLIITDVIPVIDGMLLKPVVAGEYERQLAREALGGDETEPDRVTDEHKDPSE